MKTALTIAGSDSSGGAGIQADLKTFTVLGVFGASAITAVTAQDTRGVRGIAEIDADLVRLQVDMVAQDLGIDATKTGMLPSVGVVEVVRDCIDRNRLTPYVCDPVMVAKSGHVLVSPEVVAAIRQRLVPVATILTPNLREAEVLCGLERESVRTIEHARDAARRLVDAGAGAAVVKGLRVDGQVIDVFHDGATFEYFAADELPAGRSHGSGCVYAAAIAAELALGRPLVEAVGRAKRLVTQAIRHSAGQGHGVSPVNVLALAEPRG